MGKGRPRLILGDAEQERGEAVNAGADTAGRAGGEAGGNKETLLLLLQAFRAPAGHRELSSEADAKRESLNHTESLL